MNQRTLFLSYKEQLLSRKSLFLCVLLIAIMSLAFPQPAPAKGGHASISKLILASEGKNLEAYLWVEGAFTQKIQEAIKTGLPLTFSYTIVLEKPRKIWLASEIAHVQVKHTLHYNTLREYYTVTRSWEDKPLTTADFDVAKVWMSQIGKLPIVQSTQLEKGVTYRIRVKAKLSELRLPLYLHRILFFLSYWDFETDWYSLEFTL